MESVHFSLCQPDACDCRVKLVGAGKLTEMFLCVGESIWMSNLLLQNHIWLGKALLMGMVAAWMAKIRSRTQKGSGNQHSFH